MVRQRLTENQLKMLSKLESGMGIFVLGDGRVIFNVGRGVIGLEEKYSRTLESLHKRGFVNAKRIYGGYENSDLVYRITNSGTKAYKEASKK